MVDDKVQTLLWDPSFRVPKAYDLPIEHVDADTDIEAALDSGGRTLAVTVRPPGTTEVYLGDPTDIGRSPDIVGPVSLLWHASQVGAIAWVLPGQDRQWALHTGKVDPLSGTLTNDVVVAHFSTSVGLVRWGSSGSLLNRGSDVMAVGPDIAAKRIVQVDLHVAPIGFTSSGEYLQFTLFDSNDLVFVNWRTGATHVVPIPNNTTVIGSDLG
jgi:hypothetical protein